MSNPAVRAAVYLRISRDLSGEGLAVERQRPLCLAIAEQRGWQVVAEFEDTVTASDAGKARPGYDALVAGYERGDFSAVIAYDLDRLTRQPRQLEDWVDRAEQRGLLLVTANGEADLSTDGGRMYARIKIAVARSEIERKAARQRDAARQRADLGRPPLGVRLTGYTSKGDLIEPEAEVIRQVFARFAEGDSLRGLCAWLTESGVPTRHGRPWNPSAVRTLLTNVRYAGRAVYQGKVTGKAGKWTPLVDGPTFDRVQLTLAEPGRRTHQGTDRRHLGSGLYLCGPCGAVVSSWSGSRYRCPNGCVTRSGGLVDAYVLLCVRGWLARPDLVDLLPDPDDPEAARLNALIRRWRTKLANIESDYDADRIDGVRYAASRARAAGELEAVERRMASRAPTAGAALLRAADPVAAFDAAPLMIRRGVLAALCTVHLRPAPRGRKVFDPGTVRVDWR